MRGNTYMVTGKNAHIIHGGPKYENKGIIHRPILKQYPINIRPKMFGFQYTRYRSFQDFALLFMVIGGSFSITRLNLSSPVASPHYRQNTPLIFFSFEYFFQISI